MEVPFDSETQWQLKKWWYVRNQIRECYYFRFGTNVILIIFANIKLDHDGVVNMQSFVLCFPY